MCQACHLHPEAHRALLTMDSITTCNTRTLFGPKGSNKSLLLLALLPRDRLQCPRHQPRALPVHSMPIQSSSLKVDSLYGHCVTSLPSQQRSTQTSLIPSHSHSLKTSKTKRIGLLETMTILNSIPSKDLVARATLTPHSRLLK